MAEVVSGDRAIASDSVLYGVHLSVNTRDVA